MEQELLILPKHPSSPSVCSGVRVTRSLALYYVVSIVVCPFVLFSFGHCVLFFDIRFLIAPLVSSNYSYMKENSFFAVMNVCVW